MGHVNYSHPDPLIECMSNSTYDAILGAIRRSIPEGSRVLDVGCGRGEVMARLSEAGYGVAGCDSDPVCVSAGQRHGKTRRMGVEEISPESVGRFDALTLSHVLEHVPNPSEAIRNCASVAPLLVIAVPNPLYSPFVLRALARTEAHAHPMHLHAWDYAHMRVFLEGLGLKLEGWFYDSVALPFPRRGRLLANRFGLLGPLEGKMLPKLFPRFCRSVIAVASTE